MTSESPFHSRLSRHRHELIERFLREIQRRDVAPDGVTGFSLLDSLPELFDQIIVALERNGRGSLVEHALPAAAIHGAHRWQQGFDLRAVIREYGVLENVIYKDLEEQGIEPSLREVRAFQNCLNTSVADAVLAFAEEADQLRRTLGEKQEALGESEQRLQLIAEHVPDMIWTASPDGAIEWLNQRWFEYTGSPVGPSSELDWLDAVHADDRARVRKRWDDAIRTGAPFEVESRIVARDGTHRWFLGRAAPVLDSEARLLRWFACFTDIHDRKSIEARVTAAREEAERLNRLKDEFLATVSHELRTPLQSILGWARLLRSGHVGAEQGGKALETIERNALAQSKLIEDILDVSRIITGKARIQTQAVDVAAVLGAALDTTQPAARAKGVQLVAEVPADIGSVVGDSDRLQQVVWNLLSNAVKFSPPGGRVRLGASRTPAELDIVVSDEGQGIAPAFLPYVFDRFRQADAGIARSHGGLGLGLAIVRHLVELHGGRVRATSDGIGRGATFTVHLPVAGNEAVDWTGPLEHRLRSDPPPAERASLSGLRILVVEDQSDTRELVATILRQYGAVTEVADSAARALELLGSHPFDVLVSDIGMPGEDGYSLIRTVRGTSLGGVASLPAVALTAHARVEDEQKAIECGYDVHVTKPIEPGRLVTAITSARGAR